MGYDVTDGPRGATAGAAEHHVLRLPPPALSASSLAPPLPLRPSLPWSFPLLDLGRVVPPRTMGTSAGLMPVEAPGHLSCPSRAHVRIHSGSCGLRILRPSAVPVLPHVPPSPLPGCCQHRDSRWRPFHLRLRAICACAHRWPSGPLPWYRVALPRTREQLCPFESYSGPPGTLPAPLGHYYDARGIVWLPHFAALRCPAGPHGPPPRCPLLPAQDPRWGQFHTRLRAKRVRIYNLPWRPPPSSPMAWLWR